jgi:hypothetical protein
MLRNSGKIGNLPVILLGIMLSLHPVHGGDGVDAVAAIGRD